MNRDEIIDMFQVETYNFPRIVILLLATISHTTASEKGLDFLIDKLVSMYENGNQGGD